MSKLHFKYASMNSGKSIDLMRTAYNYEEKGFKILVMKPKIDTKANTKIQSRIGLERDVDLLIGNEKIVDLLKGKLEGIRVIFIDEAQFLLKRQIDELYLICKSYNIPIICYGLRTDFKMEAFEGSLRLLEIADILEEIPTLCKCGNIARYVGRKKDGVYEQEGPSIIIDKTADYEYISLCGTCYLNDVKKIDLENIKNN